MRALITKTVDRLDAPSLADRAAARAGPFGGADHDRWMAAWSCLGAVERRAGTAPAPAGPLVAAAWNIERCFDVEGAAALIRDQGAQVLLATELDRGMARTDNRDTPTDLAAALGGWSCAFAVEFVELDHGSPREQGLAAGRDSAQGFHGNAVLSAWPIRQAAVIPLDDGGAWFVNELKEGQRRVGGRNAVAAEIDGPWGAFWAISAHFESESTPASREAEARRITEAVAALAGDDPVLLGGDLNTAALSGDLADAKDVFDHAPGAEPTFAELGSAGFDWRAANAPGATTRLREWDPATRPRRKIDWLFTRGLAASAPWVAPALDPSGATLSDHEMIGATINAA